MARTQLTKKTIVQGGLDMEVAGALDAANADGHSFEGSGRVYLEVKNGGGSACVVTVQTPVQVAGLDVAEQTVTVPATTGHVKLGPFNRRAFNRPSDGADPGLVYVDFDQVTSVSCGLFGF